MSDQKKNPEPKPELDGLDAIATYLKKSVNTVRRLINQEGLPAKKIGGEWASDKELIREWRRKRILEGKRERREVRE